MRKEGRRVCQPKKTECETQTIKRSWCFPAPLSCSMAKGKQKPGGKGHPSGCEQGKQEGISQNDLPGEFRRVGWFTGEQIPRGLSLASSNDQPEGLVMNRFCDLKSNDTGLAITTPTGIPQETMFPGTFPFADLTWFTELFLFVQELVILWPAQNKTSTMQEGLG